MGQQQEAHQQQQQQTEKMCGPPCFRSVCGMPLQKAVYIIGLIELIITVIVTIANVVKYSQFVNEEDCQGKDVCIGPIIKYCVFDAFFGILCSVLLFIGARMRHRCLLISGFSSLSAAASSTSTSSSSATGQAWRTGCPSPTWSSTPPSPWWSSPSPRSVAPPTAVLSTTMVLRQLTRLEEIFYNLCYHLPIIHAFQSSQNRYKWNLLTNVFLSRSLAPIIVLL